MDESRRQRPPPGDRDRARRLEVEPARGCSSTCDEFLATRSLFMELHADAQWNPWIVEDRANDPDDAVSIMDQWTRAESHFRPRTAKQSGLPQVRRRSQRRRLTWERMGRIATRSPPPARLM